jgi:hypothetical protein
LPEALALAVLVRYGEPDEAADELGEVLILSAVAVSTGFEELGFGAAEAAVVEGAGGLELDAELLEELDLDVDALDPLGEELRKILDDAGAGLAGAGVLEDAGDAIEGEAEGLEVLEAFDALKGLRPIKPKASFASLPRSQEAELFVETERSRGLIDLLGEIPDFVEFFVLTHAALTSLVPTKVMLRSTLKAASLSGISAEECSHFMASSQGFVLLRSLEPD